jgi:hypothetical protein
MFEIDPANIVVIAFGARGDGQPASSFGRCRTGSEPRPSTVDC